MFIDLLYIPDMVLISLNTGELPEGETYLPLSLPSLLPNSKQWSSCFLYFFSSCILTHWWSHSVTALYVTSILKAPMFISPALISPYKSMCTYPGAYWTPLFGVLNPPCTKQTCWFLCPYQSQWTVQIFIWLLRPKTLESFLTFLESSHTHIQCISKLY